MPRVLCVDDNQATLQNITEIISEWEDSDHGKFEVVSENSFEKAIERLKSERFDLVTLDLHGSSDPDPIKSSGAGEEQEGQRVLSALRSIRFIPVVFYTGYADKIMGLQSGVVKVVKKGEDDLLQVRQAIDSLYATGISRLISHIEEENRKYIWETLDRSWVGEDLVSEDFAYLLARRLGARLSRESVKELLNHNSDQVRPVEMYIYPPHNEKIKTGCIIKEGEKYWVVATPACDFAQGKAESILLVEAALLEESPQFKSWSEHKWDGTGEPPHKDASKSYNKFRSILTNNSGDRYRFLPGTFFLPNVVIDFQRLKQVSVSTVVEFNIVCRLDSPFREELLSQLSRYYGRMGVPDLDVANLIGRMR